MRNSDHVCNMRRCHGGKTGLYNHFGGTRTLFSYANLQVNNSVGGKIHSKVFQLESIASNAPCSCMADISLKVLDNFLFPPFIEQKK